MIFRIIRAKILILIRLIGYTSVYLYKIKNILPHKQPYPDTTNVIYSYLSLRNRKTRKWKNV